MSVVDGSWTYMKMYPIAGFKCVQLTVSQPHLNEAVEHNLKNCVYTPANQVILCPSCRLKNSLGESQGSRPIPGASLAYVRVLEDLR
jgi:hypothetical protein